MTGIIYTADIAIDDISFSENLTCVGSVEKRTPTEKFEGKLCRKMLRKLVLLVNNLFMTYSMKTGRDKMRKPLLLLSIYCYGNDINNCWETKNASGPPVPPPEELVCMSFNGPIHVIPIMDSLASHILIMVIGSS